MTIYNIIFPFILKYNDFYKVFSHCDLRIILTVQNKSDYNAFSHHVGTVGFNPKEALTIFR